MTAVLASPTLSQKAPPYDPGEFWDEMFEAPGVVRPHYRGLAERLATLGEAEVTTRQHAAELSFQSRGVTFAVNQGSQGVEKIMPFDLVPRMLLADEWSTIDRGLDERIPARGLKLALDALHGLGGHGSLIVGLPVSRQVAIGIGNPGNRFDETYAGPITGTGTIPESFRAVTFDVTRGRDPRAAGASIMCNQASAR